MAVAEIQTALPLTDEQLNAQLPLEAIFATTQLENTLSVPPVSQQDRARRSYMQSFVSNYPEAFTAWEHGGLLQQEDYHNIIEHCVVSAIMADILGEALQLDPRTRAKIVAAVLIHDADKLTENQRLDTLTASSRKTGILRHAATKAMENTKNQTQQALREKGVFSEDIHILSGAVVPETPDGWIDTPRQIVHWIDMTMDGSIVKDPSDRIRAASGNRRSARIQLSYSAHAKRLGISDYPLLQLTLAQQEAEQFVTRIQALHSKESDRVQSVADLPAFLQKKFQDRVRTFAQEQAA